MKRQLALRMRGESCESVTHVVAKTFRARMTSSLDPEAVVEHHPTLTSAMENFCTGEDNRLELCTLFMGLSESVYPSFCPLIYL